jgi:hypothetical protein
LLFNERAEDGFDPYDSPKMSNNTASIPEIYFLAGNEKVAINGVTGEADDREFALGFKTAQSNTFTVWASGTADFGDNLEILLIDKFSGNSEFDLTAGEVCEFTSGVVDNAERFGIIFRTPQIQNGLQDIRGNETLSVYADNNRIVVKSTGFVPENAIVSVYSVAGQKLTEQALTSGKNVIDRTLGAGVYFVKVGNKTAKVVVQ